jgi:hypothetical protein
MRTIRFNARGRARRTHPILLPLSSAMAALAVAVPTPALADPLPYGPDTCIQGYVWREARVGDTVCVTPAVRERTAQENANPAQYRDPNGGAYGPNTCLQGYVWREAFDGDTVCVTPDIRAQTLADNAAAASRKQANQPQSTAQPTPTATSTVLFEITGTGEVYSIVTDPDSGQVPDHTTTPWSRTVSVPSDVGMLQVIATSRGAPMGCRITLNGQVVAEKAPGGDAHCIWTRS